MRRRLTLSAAAAFVAFVSSKKGVTNVTASTSAPADCNTRTASWLSSPPLIKTNPLHAMVGTLYQISRPSYGIILEKRKP